MSFNLLLVDDRRDSHLLIKAYVEDIPGLKVESAYTATEALQKFSADDYHMVFLDLHLPDGDGYSILKNIKEKNKNLPVFIVSANAFEEDIQKSRELGATDHLSKPIRRQTVVDVIRKYHS